MYISTKRKRYDSSDSSESNQACKSILFTFTIFIQERKNIPSIIDGSPFKCLLFICIYMLVMRKMQITSNKSNESNKANDIDININC